MRVSMHIYWFELNRHIDFDKDDYKATVNQLYTQAFKICSLRSFYDLRKVHVIIVSGGFLFGMTHHFG